MHRHFLYVSSVQQMWRSESLYHHTILFISEYWSLLILSLLYRFEATRRIRCLESEVNDKIASGEAPVEMFGNVEDWHTPILAMTADVIQASNEECKKCGMDDYVSKPFEEEQLYTAVAKFFESG